MKKSLAILIALALCLCALPLCATADAAETQLTFVRIGNDAGEKAYWEWVIEGFEAANPGVKVGYDDAAIGEPMETKLNTLFASGSGPDLIGHGIMSVAARVTMGHYLPIDQYFEGWEGKDDILPSMLANGTYQDHVYGLAYSATPYVFAYRTDLLEAAGYKEPPKTWQELEEYARALTIKTGDEITQSGFCFPQTGGNMVEYDVFVFGNGGRYTGGDGEPTLNGQTQVTALDYLKNFLPDVNIPYSNNEANPFIKGMAAMTLINNVALTSMLADPEYEGKVGIAMPPNNGTAATFCGCNMLFIGRDCKAADEAFSFIAHALSSESTLERAKQLRIPVTRQSLVEEFETLDPYNAVRAECVKYGIGMPRVTWAATFQRLRNEVVQSVLFGGAEAQSALDKAQDELLLEMEE